MQGILKIVEINVDGILKLASGGAVKAVSTTLSDDAIRALPGFGRLTAQNSDHLFDMAAHGAKYDQLRHTLHAMSRNDWDTVGRNVQRFNPNAPWTFTTPSASAAPRMTATPTASYPYPAGPGYNIGGGGTSAANAVNTATAARGGNTGQNLAVGGGLLGGLGGGGYFIGRGINRGGQQAAEGMHNLAGALDDSMPHIAELNQNASGLQRQGQNMWKTIGDWAPWVAAAGGVGALGIGGLYMLSRQREQRAREEEERRRRGIR